jgi:hypothetical protein
MTISRSSFAVLVLLLAATAPVLAQGGAAIEAGRVKVTSGQAFIVRGGQTIDATLDQVVLETDLLRTGDDGRLGVTLQDDTRIALGPASEVRLDRFAYASEEGNVQLVLKFMRGVAAYVSGRIAKIAPDSIRLETPSAIVGVRGTTLAIRVDAE